MKKIFSLFIATVFLLSFSACDKEVKTTDLYLHFQGKFDSEPLLMYEADYDYESDMQLRFQLVQFYISQVALIKDDGMEELLDVELVSFKDIQTEEQANQGVSFLIEEIPVGNYQGIRLIIGLSEELNATQPADYIAGHPMTNHYWSWALGYVFTKIEGNADFSGDGVFDEKLTFHIGANELARDKTFSGDITLEQGIAGDVFFEVDLARVIQKEGDFIDFRKTPQDHTQNMDIARFIADNLYDALVMKSGK